MSLFSSIVKVAKSVAKSPILKVAGAGLAVAFPPAALGLAAVAQAGKVIDAAKGVIGTPAQQAAAKRAVENTVKLAKAGNVEAQAGLKAMATAEKAKALVAARGIHVKRVTPPAPARPVMQRPVAAKPVINTTGTSLGSGWHIDRNTNRITVV